MIILGINSFHADSAACIIKDGIVLAAIEEERINRVKHWAGLPIESIKACLKICDLKLKDVDYIAINKNVYSNLIAKLKYIIKSQTNLSLIKKKIEKNLINKNIKSLIESYIFNQAFKFNCSVISVEHHLAHVASACYPSGFDESANISIDGFGDFVSLSIGSFSNNKIKIDKKIFFPHSLGLFYEAVTQFLGFENYGDEYKVMGLSSYGKPTEINKIYNIINLNKERFFSLNLDYFDHHRKEVMQSWYNSSPKQIRLFNKKINSLLGSARNKNENINEYHKNLAASAQYVYEEIFFNIIDYAGKKYNSRNLTLSGGCAQNSLANRKIYSSSKFLKAYIPSNPGDAGGAIGAAYIVYAKKNLNLIKNHATAYLGDSFSNQDIQKIIIKKFENLALSKELEINFYNELEIIQETAKLISLSLVVGWFQGRMEWGPRSLGSRSILSDPRNSNVQNIINKKIKRRENFRPFAPSILAEDFDKWFYSFGDCEPYMSKVYKFKEDKVDVVPGVVHVDGTGRVQTVKETDNKKFYNLLVSFKKITNVPILLNTSFNENEPIVRTPEEALECFLRTSMDAIVLENCMIKRKNVSKKEKERYWIKD
jgi:carbamoyltransferase